LFTVPLPEPEAAPPSLISSSSETPRPIDTKVDWADVLCDLEDAPQRPVPELSISHGTPSHKVAYLFERLSKECRRNPKRFHRQMHLAYLLGAYQNDYPVQFRNQLHAFKKCERSRSRLSTAIRRTRQIGQLVGLSRLYGTTVTTFARIKAMPAGYYTNILLPALRNHQWPDDALQTSEDLVFSDGASVTSGSQAEESCEQ
jgi:hypothetical protein